MTCSICGDVERTLPYYGATCSLECARGARLLLTAMIAIGNKEVS